MQLDTYILAHYCHCRSHWYAHHHAGKLGSVARAVGVGPATAVPPARRWALNRCLSMLESEAPDYQIWMLPDVVSLYQVANRHGEVSPRIQAALAQAGANDFKPSGSRYVVRRTAWFERLSAAGAAGSSAHCQPTCLGWLIG